MLSSRFTLSVLPQLSLATAGMAANATTTSAAGAIFHNNNENKNSIVNDAAAKLLFSILPGSIGAIATNNARTLHAVLVAINLFWYQAIRQTVAVMSVFMCIEFADRGMDTSQQAQLIAAPSVGNIFTQAIGGSIIQWLPGGTKTAIAIALAGLAAGCTLLPASISIATQSSSSPLLRKAFVLLATQGMLFGAMFPSHSVLLSKWLPPNERGSAMAYGEIAMSIASMGVPLVVTSIAEYTAKPSAAILGKESAAAAATTIAGWRNGFYVTGIACFVYLGVWLVLGRSEPESCSYISKKELDLIQSMQTKSSTSASTSTNTQTTGASNNPESGDKEDTTSLPWQKILLHPSILSLFLVHMLYNFVTLSVNSWMPTYYNDVLKMPPKDSKLHIVLPQVTALLIKLCVSKIARFMQGVRGKQQQQRLVRRGSSSSSTTTTTTTQIINNNTNVNDTSMSNTTNAAAASNENDDERSMILFSRRFMGYLGFVVMAIPLWLLPMVAPSTSTVTTLGSSYYSPWWSTILFSVALAGTGFHAESFRANYLDVTQKHVGLVSGVGNCMSSISAMVAPFVVGRIIKMTSGDWSPVWRLSGASCLVAGFLFGTFSTTIPVEEQGRTRSMATTNSNGNGNINDNDNSNKKRD